MYSFLEKNKLLNPQIMELFHLSRDITSHNTHAHCNKALFIPSIKSSSYCKLSLKYMIPYKYNKFLRDHPSISRIHNVCNQKKAKFNLSDESLFLYIFLCY